MWKRYISGLLLILLSGAVCLSQEIQTDTIRSRNLTYLTWCAPEKLFVHLDRTYYAAGETIWFKGYLRNASVQANSVPSNYIYVELLDSNGKVLIRSKIKRDDDGFPGQMVLQEDIKSGYYTFRAYTLWQLNKSPEYFFTQRIKILGCNVRQTEPKTNSDTIHIDFYPEGGRYFCGQPSIIAFKAMDGNGRSADVKCYLTDASGNILFPIVTTHDGMGSFTFIPKEGEEYFLKLNDLRQYKLPAPAKQGGSIGVRITDEKIYIKACALSGGRCTIMARNADAIAPIATIPDDGKAYKVTLEKGFFKTGLSHILLLDSGGHIMSERMFYILEDNLPEGKFTAKITRQPHGPITGRLCLNDKAADPIDAKVSISIIRGSFEDYIQDDNLVSYMGLTSELKGKINNPKHYFDSRLPIRERKRDIDLLMMTQGWRYYEIEKILDPSAGAFNIKYLKEYKQSVQGLIKRSSGKKPPENFYFTVIIPKLHFNRIVTVKQATSFLIDSLDFPQSTPFVIATTRKGLGYDYIPSWPGETFAPTYKHAAAPGSTNDSVKEQNMPLFTEIVQTDTLQAAIVTAEESDILGGGLSSRKVPKSDLETYSYQTLIQYLLMKYPGFEYNGEIMYNRQMRSIGGRTIDETEDFILTERDEEHERGLVKLIENDTETPWWPYESTYLDEIEYLSVSTQADTYYNADGGFVAIKLYEGGKGALKVRESLLYIVPLGYQEPSKFYNPRYDLGDPHDTYDHRNTIFWEPQAKVHDGCCELNFCDTDQRDYPYIVTVQGYSSTGEAISYQFTIGEGQ